MVVSRGASRVRSVAESVMSDDARRARIVLAGVLALSAALMLANIRQPWIGIDGNAGVKRSVEAKNYLRHGFIATKFGLANNYEHVSDVRDLHYYQHHPPLTSVIIAMSFLGFGTSEASARLPFILLTLSSILMLYVIAKRCYGERAALLSAFIFSILPMTTFFGRVPSYEVVTLFFILASVHFYLKWLDREQPAFLWLFLCGYFAALWSDWPAYFLGVLVFGHFLWAGRANKTKGGRTLALVLIPAVTVAAFASFLYYAYLVRPSDVHDLFHQLKIYMGLVARPSIGAEGAHGGEFGGFGLGLFAKKMSAFSFLMFTYPVHILAVFGALHLGAEIARARRQGGETGKSLIAFVFLLLAVAYNGVFYRSVFIHNFWIFYFGVPLSLLAAVGIEGLLRTGRRNEAGAPVWRFASAYAFMIVLVLGAALWNVRDVQALQRKVLPGNRYESVTLARNVATHIGSVSSGEDVILTNMPMDGGMTGPILAYYAERRMGGGITDARKAEAAISSGGRGRTLFYLFVGGRDERRGDDDLEGFLRERYPSRTHEIEGYRFAVFEVRGDGAQKGDLAGVRGAEE